jgi:cytochrome oxidase Cu insertion factor (SCO1/SenC/PrrC family)
MDLRIHDQESGARISSENQEDFMLEIGSQAPDFTADDQDGQSVSLEGLRGKWVAIWWYPKASTPG